MGKIHLSSPCPICGERIFMNSHGYQCECCSFNFSYYICNRYIDKKEAEVILGGERIIFCVVILGLKNVNLNNLSL